MSLSSLAFERDMGSCTFNFLASYIDILIRDLEKNENLIKFELDHGRLVNMKFKRLFQNLKKNIVLNLTEVKLRIKYLKKTIVGCTVLKRIFRV